jgi:murein DD-endopeptidase MepM/ murein hydrolase activator NlpD
MAAVGAASIVLACGGALALGQARAMLAASQPTAAASCGAPQAQVHDANAVTVPGFTGGQVANGRTIVRTGQEMQVPPRGWVVAVATAMQESNLRNLANPKVPASMRLPHEGTGTDHDSVGLFQQRPSPPDGVGSWGTVQELMTPTTSAKKFFAALLKVKDWQSLPLTVAAQRVQRSAFPNAYAKHESKAAALVGAVSGGADRAATQPGQCAQPDQVTAGGWVRPVSADVGSGFRTASRPTHQGVDLGASRGTKIVAASAGTVIKVRCQARLANGTDWGCWRDGSPTVIGCGWYVEIQHADGVLTRSCHMVKQPAVAPGQQVTAGQEIGFVGSTGRSSGPHLHFEVHLRGDASKNGAVDPVPFMKARGAPLGSAA